MLSIIIVILTCIGCMLGFEATKKLILVWHTMLHGRLSPANIILSAKKKNESLVFSQMRASCGFCREVDIIT